MFLPNDSRYLVSYLIKFNLRYRKGLESDTFFKFLS